MSSYAMNRPTKWDVLADRMEAYRYYRTFSFYRSSSEIAADRLRWIIRRDREVCGDGRWVKARPYMHGLSRYADIAVNRHYWKFSNQLQKWGRRVDIDKTVCRWEPRR